MKTNWGSTVISRSRTVLSPPFPAALCHGTLEAFCSHSLAPSSISSAGDRRALHAVLLSEITSPNPCLLTSDLLYSHTTPCSWLVLIMLGLHPLAVYSVGSCCNPESCSFIAANVRGTYFQLGFLSDLWVQLAQSAVLGLSPVTKGCYAVLWSSHHSEESWKVSCHHSPGPAVSQLRVFHSILGSWPTLTALHCPAPRQAQSANLHLCDPESFLKDPW